MDLHLYLRSRPSQSVLSTGEPAHSTVVLLRLRLSEARAPLNLSPSGDVVSQSQDMEVRLDRAFVFNDVYEFVRPGKARKAVAEMLATSRSVWPVGEGALAIMVQRVCDDFISSAMMAMSMPPCNVIGVVHILLVPANHGTGVGGGGLSRALLESREAHDREWSAFGPGEPASEAAIEELETVAYPGPKGEDRCVVCYEEFAPPREMKKTPCGHLFDGECIVQWLQRSHRCPLCRFEMPKEEAAPPPS